jgi:hypothetical protein
MMFEKNKLWNGFSQVNHQFTIHVLQVINAGGGFIIIKAGAMVGISQQDYSKCLVPLLKLRNQSK